MPTDTGRRRGRIAAVGAVAVLGSVLAWGPGGGDPIAAAAAATTVPGPAPAAPPAPLTGIPPIPPVPPTITNGADPAKLLAAAIALATAGSQNTPLQASLAIATAQLDRQAVLAAQADAALAAATRVAADAAARAAAARADARNLKGALVEAALRLYMLGPSRVPIPQDHDAQTLVDGAVFEQTILSPQGILAKRRVDANTADAAARTVVQAREQAAADDRAASAARNAAAAAQSQIEAQLTGLTTATALLVSTERSDVSKQAATVLTSPTALDWAPASPLPAPVATTDVALAWIFSELGKPYTWGGTGPDTFDCSGLTQFAWHAAGVITPRVAQDQEGWTVPVPLSQIIPGDLVFYGTASNIHHVAMYIGDGLMINAPHTGDVVRISPMWWSDLYGFGRVHAAGTPVPVRPPAPAQPVVATAGTVPAQHAPPPGWAPTPGGSAPLPGYYPPIGVPPAPTTTSTSSTSTTTVPAPPTSPPPVPSTILPGP